MSSLLAKVILSAIGSLVYGLMGYIVFCDQPNAGVWALICMLGAFSMLLLMMLLREEIIIRRFKRAEKELPAPSDFQVNAHLRQGRTVVNVRVCLCGEDMYLLNVDRKTSVATRLTRQHVRRAETPTPVELRLTLQDGRCLQLVSSDMEELVAQLCHRGWAMTDLKR